MAPKRPTAVVEGGRASIAVHEVGPSSEIVPVTLSNLLRWQPSPLAVRAMMEPVLSRVMEEAATFDIVADELASVITR